MLQAGHHGKRACDASAYSSALTMDLHYGPSARMTNQQQPRRIRKERVGQQICELAGVGMDRRQRVVGQPTKPIVDATAAATSESPSEEARRSFFDLPGGGLLQRCHPCLELRHRMTIATEVWRPVGLRDRHDLFVPTVKPIRPCPTIDWIRPRKRDQVAMPGANGKPPMTAPTTARQAVSSFEPASIRASRSRTCQ
jgi:hypothetical protein